jgi:hypothetical protein
VPSLVSQMLPVVISILMWNFPAPPAPRDAVLPRGETSLSSRRRDGV